MITTLSRPSALMLIAVGTVLMAIATTMLCWLMPSETQWLIGLAVGGVAGLALAPRQQISVAIPAVWGLVLLTARWPLPDAGSAGVWVGQGLVILICCPVKPGSLHYLAAWSAVTAVIAASLVNRVEAEVRVATIGTAVQIAAAAAVLSISAMAIDTRLVAVRGRVAGAYAGGRIAVILCALSAIAAGWLLIPLSINSGLRHETPQPAVGQAATAAAAARHVATGLDHQIRIDARGGSISQNPVHAAFLRWPAGQRPVEIPARGSVYLKALTLSRLTVDRRQIHWQPLDSQRRSSPTGGPRARRENRATVTRLPGGGDVCLVPDGFVPADLDPAFRNGEGNWFVHGFGERQQTYAVDPIPPSAITAEQREMCLEIPTELQALPWAEVEDPAWAELTAPEVALQIARMLDQRCRYAMVNLPSGGSGSDGLRRFLFGSVSERRGHCQFFASAAALLLRRARHPARLAIGFSSDERGDHEIVFRGYHAHAWVELLDRDQWRRFDPTPAQARLDYISGTSAAAGPERDSVSTTTAPRTGGTAGGLITIIIALVVVALVLLFRSRRHPAALRRARLNHHAQALLGLAHELGYVITPGTTLGAAVHAIGERLGPGISDRLEPILHAHQQARFADGPEPQPWPLAELRTAAAARGKA